jgi:GH24 family phage-related lysozyme (muramidase)
MKNLKIWITVGLIVLVGIGVQFLMSYQTPTELSPVTPIAVTDSINVDTTFIENTIDSVFLNAIEHLKSYEGFRSKIYIDVDGSRTIGYGHHLLKGETYSNISEAKATEILENDLRVRLDYIQNKHQVTGDTLIALGLFSFNCGTGTLAKAIKHGILTQPTKLLQYCHYKTYGREGNAITHTSPKLLQRRNYEIALITNKKN